MVDFSLKGKVALVTGAAYGIGFAIAEALAGAGAKIAFNCRSQRHMDEALAAYAAKGIDVREEEGAEMGDTSAYEYCRQFAVSEGVAGCVLSRVEDPQSIRTLPINGVDKKIFRLMKSWEKRAPEVDLVEVMCCEGGCINGPGTIVKPAVAMKLRGGSKAASPVASVKKGI